MKITKRKDKIIFEFPARLKRVNPYDEDEVGETYPFFTGLIIKHRKGSNRWDEIGFAQTIDMAYKDKPDQTSDFIVKWTGEEKAFIVQCKILGISWMTINA